MRKPVLRPKNPSLPTRLLHADKEQKSKPRKTAGPYDPAAFIAQIALNQLSAALAASALASGFDSAASSERFPLPDIEDAELG